MAVCAPRHIELFSQNTASIFGLAASMSSIKAMPPSALQLPKSGAVTTVMPGYVLATLSMPLLRFSPIELSAGPPRSWTITPFPPRRSQMYVPSWTPMV